MRNENLEWFMVHKNHGSLIWNISFSHINSFLGSFFYFCTTESANTTCKLFIIQLTGTSIGIPFSCVSKLNYVFVMFYCFILTDSFKIFIISIVSKKRTLLSCLIWLWLSYVMLLCYYISNIFQLLSYTIDVIL